MKKRVKKIVDCMKKPCVETKEGVKLAGTNTTTSLEKQSWC